ncbi:MAG: hypothetical protein GWO86_02560 [Planctomycetes bacterium]|nr:hypothetical protein [Planctomycetota bacterium]
MKRTILSAILVVFLTTLAGCILPDREERFMIDSPEPVILQTTPASATAEVGMAEALAAKRLAYRRDLETLETYYKNSGNNIKLQWVQKELAAIDSAPRYRYIIEAEVAGPELKAKDSIPEADRLFGKAMKHYNKAKRWIIIASKKNLRLALAEFNQLIKEYPTSDKIDDAAYRAARIHEHFKDYAIAVLYYKRAFQWDSETIYPARLRAARLLDHQLQRRTEALKLYREGIEKESRNEELVKLAKERIAELTAANESIE